MPGSTNVFPPTKEEVAPKSQQNMMGTRQPPPVAPRTTSISLQPWQPTTAPDEGSYAEERYARSASTDSLESSGSSSSGGGSANNRIADVGALEFIPTRNVGKAPKLPPHNPLQFVKVQSPLYIKAEQQIKLTKEVKVTREALKEGEEEWQSNLDNWKSRRRKVSEKVIQRAEEMRQIEIEEQFRQEKLLQQQKKIKKFSEIVEKKSTRSYNLELYIGQGDDSGLGGTPEPDDILDSQSSILRSDTSEGMTSEAESVDSDIHKSDKISMKDPPKVPQKPYSRLKKTPSVSYDGSETNMNELFQHCLSKQDLAISDNSSTDPSDIEGHAADTEATSSEEDATFSGQICNTDSGLESSCDNRGGLADSASDLSQDSTTGLEKRCEEQHDILSGETTLERKMDETTNKKIADSFNQSFKICIRQGDKGFGFTLKGGKDQGCPACIESVVKDSPADEIGLMDGDKIISLNGECTDDYSHASLIFSIKQALYTGILDISISRTDMYGDINPEMKTKKGNSFAEKLALFSSGANVPTTNSEESKSNAKLTETKRESLVLRRRSTFENGKAENAINTNVVNRRSSCVSHTANTSSEKKLDKRHSVDLALSQNAIHENNFSRKGPPPPVPVKPKIKSKAALFEVNKSPSSILNGSSENILSPTGSIINGSENLLSESQNGNQSVSDTLNVLENDKYDLPIQEMKCESHDSPIELDKMNSVLNIVSERSSPNFQMDQTVNDVICHEDLTTLSCDLEIFNCPNVAITESNVPMENITDVKIKEIDYHSSDYSNEKEISFESKDETSDSFCDKIENPELGTSDALVNYSYELKSGIETCMETTYKDTEILSHETTSLHFHEKSDTECAIDYVNDIVSANCVGDNIVKEKVSDTESSFITSACHSTCDIDEINETNVKDGKDIEVTDESEITENKNFLTNSSPLCLSLEKIDEDDVISASTTTSSGTPDTETVIETLPSNLSPLPNDESNGEDSSKLLNCDEESEQPVETIAAIEESSSDINNENKIQNIENENIDVEEFEPSEGNLEHTYDAFASGNVNDNVIEESFYNDQQDDEYARELDESLDQITSLDIIDRIEQSLMDQLQKDNAYEDIGSNLNSELESDVSNPWLYFSEESELLDDLTPRNLEPPREPPPPPPPPEEVNESKVMPLGRTNSTKRIKKEIWRRRSDFLGIDSTEVNDVDSIPPPLGLEELLKQEREQTQWLEKQLCLPDPEVEIPFTAESTCLDSGNYSNNDYSEYYADEDVDSSKENVIDHEQWEENLDEEALFENSYGLQYDSTPENVCAVIDESNTKTCENPQHKAKQNIQSLGAAPKAKIMDSAKWITEKVETVNKKSIEPVFRQTSYNQNYWLAQDGERRRSLQHVDSHSDRRYSMPPVYSNNHPDVTVRTWGDREYEYQQHRPRSAIYDKSVDGANMYGQHPGIEKKDLQRTQSLDSQREVNFETDTLESEVHKCSCCGKGLCEGSAMGIEALQLYFHIECFRCCVCLMQLGNGSCGTDVQVKNNQLYCPACFTVD